MQLGVDYAAGNELFLPLIAWGKRILCETSCDRVVGLVAGWQD